MGILHSISYSPSILFTQLYLISAYTPKSPPTTLGGSGLPIIPPPSLLLILRDKVFLDPAMFICLFIHLHSSSQPQGKPFSN